MKKITAGLIVIGVAAFLVAAIFVPFRFLIPDARGDIESAKTVTSLELTRFELVGRPANLRKWLTRQDGAPGQEVAMRFVGWGLTHQSDFAFILDGIAEPERTETIDFLASMINDRFAEDAFLSSFNNQNSSAINELRAKILQNRNGDNRPR
ncbi:MAG: hypothetical protein ABL952_05505 [Pyrinomonadaceae bacterium]